MNTSPPVEDLASIGALADFVARAWTLHAARPAEVAAALRTRAPGLGADGADAIGLAEHVWLSHLGDEAGLAAFLAALPAAARAAPDVAMMDERARWVLAMLSGADAPPPADGPRWRALQNLWAVWAARGRAADAQAMLQAEEPRALAHADVAARRALAATCNNLAVELRCGRRGDAAVDALMLALAAASRRLWAASGTWLHVERADYQLARCHAALGDGERALSHARAGLAAIDAHADAPEADAFERFFAHEALAWAQRAAGDSPACAAEQARMAALAAAVTDADLRAWCAEAQAELAAAAR